MEKGVTFMSLCKVPLICQGCIHGSRANKYLLMTSHKQNNIQVMIKNTTQISLEMWRHCLTLIDLIATF